MADVKIRHWVNQVEAVLDSQAEVRTLSRGDTETILTPGCQLTSSHLWQTNCGANTPPGANLGRL